MILVNKHIRRDSTAVDIGGVDEECYLNLPKILIPNTDEFFNIINAFPQYKEYYDKVNIREGSKVKLSSNKDDYSFGCNDHMIVVFGTIQEIKKVRRDGRIFFNSEHRILTSWSYGIGEVLEIIEY